ncbi:MAG: DUF1573 domain-containing protein [Ignavibacteriae bacterium]|nr:DUF1573 domain-containing protein [Ignavibacteriota bacterium]
MSNFLNSNGGKASFFAIGLAIIVGIMFFVVSNNKIVASNSSAHLVFNETVHDFGTVPEGPQIEYNFKFVNKGSTPLKIDKVTTSCGCTAATTNGKEEYGKGEEGSIHVTFNTRGRSGVQEKTLMVFSNDSKEPQQTLKITCNIDPNAN